MVEPLKPRLGVCYYPEHWEESLWRSDARRMAELGVQLVRIGEFSWSRLEPRPGQLEWQWLDRAMKVLSDAGLHIVLATPTAAPPRWMLDKYPDMPALTRAGTERGFGSRRHYCFSHAGYLDEARRIAGLMAQRYGGRPELAAWQIDNEYGCHNTTVSWSEHAHSAFRHWLERRYRDIDRLNRAWGNVFWSMEYNSFAQIELPDNAVTESNPAHLLDFRRFSSDQVVAWNRAQAKAIRRYSSAPLIHNYMGRYTGFDHYRLGADLDIAGWDSYPVGFLDHPVHTDEQWRTKYYRQGDPDFQAFHHDLYRAVGAGRWWVMEQQPGPVNWAHHNPAPLKGMVRLWTWEAIAHQAEVVGYFRWRQAPFAQEQMHSGLLNPDDTPANAWAEVQQVARELRQMQPITGKPAKVALVFDYESCWAWQIQPQGGGFDYFELVLHCYRGLRQLGLSIDILPPTVDNLRGYSLLVIAGLFAWNPNLLNALEQYRGQLLIGPRTASKTENFTIPATLPPALDGLPLRVTAVESLRPGIVRKLRGGGHVERWMEMVESDCQVVEQTLAGEPVLLNQGHIHYLAGWPCEFALRAMLKGLCARARVATVDMPEGVRRRETANYGFLTNYNDHSVTFDGVELPAAGVHCYGLQRQTA